MKRGESELWGLDGDVLGTGRNEGPRKEALPLYSLLLKQPFFSVYWVFSSVFLEKGSHQAFSKSTHQAPPQTNGMRTSEGEAQASVVFLQFPGDAHGQGEDHGPGTPGEMGTVKGAGTLMLGAAPSAGPLGMLKGHLSCPGGGVDPYTWSFR